MMGGEEKTLNSGGGGEDTKYQGTTITRCNLHFNDLEWAKIQVHNRVVQSDTLARHNVQNKGSKSGHKKRHGYTNAYVTFVYENCHFYSMKIALWSG
jgi:hypothetical protein